MFQNYLKAEKIFRNFGYGALITINSKINEVDKSRLIRINKRLKESKTPHT